MQQAQPSRIPLTPRQRIFLTLLFLLALTLSYFVVSTVDPLASHLRLFSINESRVNATIAATANLPIHPPARLRNNSNLDR